MWVRGHKSKFNYYCPQVCNPAHIKQTNADKNKTRYKKEMKILNSNKKTDPCYKLHASKKTNATKPKSCESHVKLPFPAFLLDCNVF